MATIQIKNVPDEVHETLRIRAAEAHQSLQEYMRAHLIKEASQPTLAEILKRTSRIVNDRISPAEAAAMIREDRDSR